LLLKIRDKQIDYTHLLKMTVKLDEAKSLKKLQGRLLSIDDSSLNDLLYDAVKSKSFKSTMHLLQADFILFKNM